MAMEYVNLSSIELKEKGSELANAVSDLYRIRRQKKDAMNGFKTAIDAKERQIADLTETVRTGRELRSRTLFDETIDD